MEPVMIEQPQIILAGMSFFGDPFALSEEWTEENEIGRLWNRLMAFLTTHVHLMPQVKNGSVGYEVCIEHKETAQKGHVEVFVGIEITTVQALPVELLIKILPSATYAMVTLQGDDILSDWHRTMQQWMKQAGYQQAYPYEFQRYDQRFKGLDRVKESEIEAYLPVKCV